MREPPCGGAIQAEEWVDVSQEGDEPALFNVWTAVDKVKVEWGYVKVRAITVTVSAQLLRRHKHRAHVESKPNSASLSAKALRARSGQK